MAVRERDELILPFPVEERQATSHPGADHLSPQVRSQIFYTINAWTPSDERYLQGQTLGT